MTISDVDAKGRFQGNGVTTSFAVPFDVQDNTNIVVIIRDESVTPAVEVTQVLTTNYTLTGDPATLVVMVTAPATTDVLVIKRVNPITQATDYVQGDGFPEDAHEEALDKLTRIVQELNEAVTRCLKLAVTTAVTDFLMPVLQNDKFLRINSDSTGIVLDDGTTTDTLPTVTGSIAAPTVVTAGTGVAPAGVQNETIFVKSASGLVDITANPQVAVGTSVSQRLTLIGTSDSEGLLFETGNGLYLDGSIELYNNDILDLIWNGSVWAEVSRNN